jgi:hypothetical protein
MPQHVFTGLCDIATGLLFIAANLPFALRKVRPNRFYGVPAAFFFRSDETAWYEINEYGGRQQIVWTLPLFLAGILTMLLPLDPWLANKAFLIALAAGPPTLCYNIPFIITTWHAWKKRSPQRHEDTKDYEEE